MRGKLETKWKGPYEVIQAMSKGRYQLKAESGKIMSKLYHGALIKAYMQPEITDIQKSVAHDTSDAQYASKHQISNEKKTCKPGINAESAADSSGLSKYTYIYTYIHTYILTYHTYIQTYLRYINIHTIINTYTIYFNISQYQDSPQ